MGVWIFTQHTQKGSGWKRHGEREKCYEWNDSPKWTEKGIDRGTQVSELRRNRDIGFCRAFFHLKIKEYPYYYIITEIRIELKYKVLLKQHEFPFAVKRDTFISTEISLFTLLTII